MLQNLDYSLVECQALVLAPTRELVAQIGKEAKRFGKAVGVSAVSAYGGAALGTQVSDLKRGAEIVAASPGRLIDVLAMGVARHRKELLKDHLKRMNKSLRTLRTYKT